jgi:hypothetical protein
VQPELELGDHAKVAATAAQAPVQVGVLGLAGPHEVAVGGHDLEAGHVVARQAEPARQPAHPATQRQPADTGV